jgi:chromosome transmission fidelity protein 1
LEKDTSANSDVEEPICVKIFYASRTHSQLAQVLHELRKLKLANISPEVDCLGEEEDLQPVARVVSLASRKQLCINENLQKSAGDLDEKCRDILSGEYKYSWITHTRLRLAQTKEGKDALISLRYKTRLGCLTFETKYW